MKTSVISAFLAATNPEKEAEIPDGQFVEILTSYLPDGVFIPEPLERTLNWMELKGWYQVADDGENPEDYLLHIYPPQQLEEHPNHSWVTFGPETFAYTKNWDKPDLAINNRIIPIALTSGDGGRAVIWVDDQGEQWFAHLGHDTLGIISDDPLVFLQFMAMGYLEPGALTRTDISPIEEAMAHHGLSDTSQFNGNDPDITPTMMPTALQEFLQSQFGILIPETAYDLGISGFTQYGDTSSADPFAKWITAITPVSTPKRAAKLETEDLRDTIAAVDIGDVDKPRGFLGKLKRILGADY